MLNPYLVADIAIAVVLLLISLFVISKNSKAQINRVFFVAVIFMSAWIVSNYFSNDQQLSRTSALIANHLILFFSGLLIYYLAYFSALLCKTKYFIRNVWWVSVANYLVALLALTPLVIQDIVRQKDVYGLNFGPLAFIYFGAVGLNAAVITYSLIRGLKKSFGSERLRIQTVFWSLVTTLVIILFTNAVLPIIGIATLSNIGPLASVIFVTGVAYSIVRHKLFDIRSVVARSVAYVLLLATLTLLFVVGVFGITSLFFQQDQLSTAVRLTFAVLAIVLAFGLQPLKHFFDRITNQLFYRDAYDSQELLNELNRSLVTTIDLNDLLNRSAKIIGETLKSQYCAFAIQEPSSDQFRFTGTRENFGQFDTKKLSTSLSRHHEKIVVADEIESASSEIKRLLQEADISVLIKLQGTARGRPEHPGYILLGQKRSGNLYSSQDITVLEIIADELVIAIQNSLRFEEIQQFNITLQAKIDEATKKLRHANVRLKELDATKDEFISMASHQLRTPLTTIKGYLSMILDGDVGTVKKEEKELVQHAFDSAQRMVYLIADLLNVSRLQTGKFVIENKPTDLAKVVDGEITQLGEQATTRNIRLAYDKPKEFPALNLDETKIRQVIMNFLDNALYYTPKDGEVTAKLEATQDSVNFTVTDTGVGVPASLQHHLFTKFYRADNARKMRPDGTGLGLYMAKKVIVAQGGAVIFKSTEGKGSTFGFSFPRKTMEVKA
jgi:signal transduction histidine kinase